MQFIVYPTDPFAITNVPCGVTIGNFDGVHLGHQHIIKWIAADAKSLGLPLLVATFTPHPKMILSPQTSPKLLTRYDERRMLLGRLGIDYLMEIPFDRDLSNLSAEQFLTQVLMAKALIGKLYLGHDFALGKNKSGTHEMIKLIAQKHQFPVQILDPYLEGNEKVSSSVIRKCLIEGEVAKASLLLGRNYSLTSSIQKGEGRGKKIGIPTANFAAITDKVLPARGVYKTKVIIDGENFSAVTNIGINPTFNGTDNENQIETHILNFSRDIYGLSITVEFIHRIREERKFQSVTDLVSQIHLDIVSAWGKGE